ncbi:hypothetical protein F3Y22_tig00110059pilonHSYRG00075 [Hibiscus syriacus]|uniref:Uncharacterized protein n=1 Tax=Hibiscus syriacus TaxID=106335 RepID=A0A6A3BLC6_HIBSY|nr:hypothetical protein F3Y22_tig00110059pilonHSYRG00075 [Hibiscus syriacus]
MLQTPSIPNEMSPDVDNPSLNEKPNEITLYCWRERKPAGWLLLREKPAVVGGSCWNVKVLVGANWSREPAGSRVEEKVEQVLLIMNFFSFFI